MWTLLALTLLLGAVVTYVLIVAGALGLAWLARHDDPPREPFA